MTTQPGLRQRKKEQSRLAISDVATRLFIEHGFDNVTLAQVALAANVSVNTIFNYFKTKEELFFDRGDAMRDALIAAVTHRPVGETVLDALHRTFKAAIQQPHGLLQQRSVHFVRAVDASPALQLRARALLHEGQAALAQVLATETGAPKDDATPHLVAALLVGWEAALVEEFRARLLRGESEKKIRAALLRSLETGFVLLKGGVGRYAVQKKRTAPPSSAG